MNLIACPPDTSVSGRHLAAPFIRKVQIMNKPLLLAMGASLFLAPLMSVAGMAEARSSCTGLSAATLAERLAADKCSDGAELSASPVVTPAKTPLHHPLVAVAAPATADDQNGGGKKGNGNGNGNGGKNGLPVAADAVDDHKGGGKGNGGGGKNGLPVAADATDAGKGAGDDQGDNVNYALPKGANQPKKITHDPAGDHLTASQPWLGKGHDHDHEHDRDSASHDSGKDPSGA
jgi:hypothetical protein